MLCATGGKITLQNFAYKLRELGFVYALNLDGGGSTSLYYEDGRKNTRIVGKSSHGYDHIKYEQDVRYGRKVPYMIGIPRFVED